MLFVLLHQLCSVGQTSTSGPSDNQRWMSLCLFTTTAFMKLRPSDCSLYCLLFLPLLSCFARISDMRGDVQAIFKETPHDKQVMMFSATMAKEIRGVCKKFMNKVRGPLKMSAQPHLAGHPHQAPAGSVSSTSMCSPSTSASTSNTSIYNSNAGNASISSTSNSITSLQSCVYKQQVASKQLYQTSPATLACRHGTAGLGGSAHLDSQLCWAVQFPVQLAAVVCG
jgi:hypothetical protein